MSQEAKGARSGMNNVSELSIDEIKEEPDSDTEKNTSFSVCQGELPDIKKEFPVTFIAVKSESEVHASVLVELHPITQGARSACPSVHAQLDDAGVVDVINEKSEPDELCSTYFQSGSLLVDIKHEEDPLLIKFEKKDINLVDDRVRPYSCEICHKSFTQRSVLFTHYRVHSEERPFVCEVCNKSFKHIGALQRHQLLHSGERPYSCHVCKKAFGDLGNLKKHLRVHTGERPYSCDICKRTFGELSNLKKHSRLHTGERPYVCDVCEKSFYARSDLNGHRRVHSGERPYLCDVCKKSFKQRGDMTRHMRLHTGERPYSCEICKRSFAILHHLRNHHRTHAKKNSE